jgi:hypothetical protein
VCDCYLGRRRRKARRRAESQTLVTMIRSDGNVWMRGGRGSSSASRPEVAARTFSNSVPRHEIS